jgi:hypothetical protein
VAGRIVVAGAVNTITDVGVARLVAANGATDGAFDGDGRATVDTGGDEVANHVVVLPDGRVAIAGSTSSGPNPSNGIVALLSDGGAPEAGFGNVPGTPGVAVHDFAGAEDIDGLAAQPDGRLVVVGTAFGATRDFLTARLQGPAPVPGELPRPPAPDGTRPVVSGLTATRVFAAANRGAAILAGRRRVPVGAAVRYGLSEAAATRFTVERAKTGRRVGRRCVKTTRRNRSRRKCTRYVRVRGSFVHQGAAGLNRFRFSGRLRNRRLPVGRYRLVAVATDVAGNRSAAKRRAFRIVRR